MIVAALFRYPVKSMAGEHLETTELGFRGIPGDRRHALRKLGDRGGFPWLQASRLPELVRYTPRLPSIVTPDGRELPADEAVAEIAQRYGHPLELMHLDRGIFDEAAVSLITIATIGAHDVRRFRPNILLRADDPPFGEDAWVGRTLVFDGGPEIAITMRDERCAIINVDPDTAESDPTIFKTIARDHGACAGVYATVTKSGRLVVGQRVRIAG